MGASVAQRTTEEAGQDDECYGMSVRAPDKPNSSIRKRSRKEPQQHTGHGHVARKFSDRHIKHAGPERQTQPAGYRAKRVADQRQPGQQTGLSPEAFEPSKRAWMRRAGV